MKYENIMVYLEHARVFCFQNGDNLLQVPIEGDWDMKHLDQALREACDIIYDYQKAAEQAARMIEKYETPKKAIRIGDYDLGRLAVWKCPSCNKLISQGNEHCHWCGRKIGWEWRGKGVRKGHRK